jgi:hypothetical protein
VKTWPSREYPRLISIPSEQITAYWQPDDLDITVAYKIAWEVKETSDKIILYQQDIVALRNDDGDIVDWLIRNLRKGDRDARWVETSQELWGHEWPPILDWKNLPNPKIYYGSTDLKEAYANNFVNFLASNTQRIIKYHAHPRDWATGVGEQQITQSEVGGLWTVGATDARIGTLEMQSELGSSMGMLRLLVDHFYARHQAVDLTSVRERLRDVTNFGLQTLHKDALDKLEVKKWLYGNALRELSRRLMVLDGQSNALIPRLHWDNPLPFSRLEEITTVKMMMELGILSRETATEVLGHDWEVEQERMQADSTSLGDIILRRIETEGV